MKDIPSPVVMLVVPEKIPVKQEDGEIVYMSQMEINEGIPAGKMSVVIDVYVEYVMVYQIFPWDSS